MLVREIFPKLGWKVPVSVHHHLLPGLSEPSKLGLTEDSTQDSSSSSKMSKSQPSSSITIHDNESAILNKINKGYCPVGISQNNPQSSKSKEIASMEGILRISIPRN